MPLSGGSGTSARIAPKEDKLLSGFQPGVCKLRGSKGLNASQHRLWAAWVGPSSRLRTVLKLGMIAALAMLHLVVVASYIGQYYTPAGIVSMTFREEQVSLSTQGGSGRSSSSISMQSRTYSGSSGSEHSAAVLLTAIQDLKSAAAAAAADAGGGEGSKFASLGDEEIISRLEAALELEDFSPPDELGLDKNAFCKLIALKSLVRHGDTTNGIQLETPVVASHGEGVILTTYFNSRIDPLRCYKHKGGHLQPDAFDYIEHWYTSVVRLGLQAVVFHEGLSTQFVERVQTDSLRFQRVALAHHDWSLCDERWAVYLEWLQQSGSTVRYVLQVDISDTVISQNPFRLFGSQSGQYDLWVNVQKNTDWVQQNYVDCYGNPQPFLLGEKGLVYNAGVVGGKREAFEDLATAIVTQFRPMLGLRGGGGGGGGSGVRMVWNCDMAALHQVLTHPSFLAGHRIFNGGFPFCAGGIKCWKHGECRYFVYHK